MAISMIRYFNRKKITLRCETVTPMFLGNAGQDAEWRVAPFKGMLRYWWRVSLPDIRTYQALLMEESRIFGSAGDAEESVAGKSCVSITLSSRARPVELRLPELPKINHPECERQDREIDPLLYLANMGIMQPGGRVRHSYFPAGSAFEWTIEYPESAEAAMKPVIILIKAFGAVGARSRNGWGSFQVNQMECEPLHIEEWCGILDDCTKEWTKGFEKDYPNCLGVDTDAIGKGKGDVLLWKTKIMPDWQSAMRELADAYVGVRARGVAGIGKLDANGKDQPSERHLLGFPLTNHPAKQAANWGNQGRHASSLRFVVRKKSEGFQGFVLHLPHRFSDQMSPMSNEKQIEVWKKVHTKLDAILKRANYTECLK
jgi:CRISPR-associated protein Cmr1